MKGHIGAVKSMIAELTDETNVARGFSMAPVGLVPWICDWVRRIVLLSLNFQLTSLIPLVP
jgi:hypothetical protein